MAAAEIFAVVGVTDIFDFAAAAIFAVVGETRLANFAVVGETRHAFHMSENAATDSS